MKGYMADMTLLRKHTAMIGTGHSFTLASSLTESSDAQFCKGLALDSDGEIMIVGPCVDTL